MSPVNPDVIATISIMPVSKTVIPLDDEETIRRFTEEIRRRSTPSLPSLQVQVENLESTINQRNGDSHVEHRATQTEPVTITAANGVSQARNGFLAKPKSALDSVLLQSPPESGVMAPPSTPENRPGLSNFEISQLIIDSIERLPATSTFTLGESRHAPSRSSSAGRQTITRGSSANDHVSSLMPGEQISQADRNVRNQSFTRMSFQAADSPPITAPAPVAFSAAESSTNVVKSTSPPPVPAGASASSTNTTAEISSLSVLEKSVSSSRWASPRDYPRPNPPATDPASARPPALISWNSFAGIGSDVKEKPEDVKEKPKDVKEKPKDVKEKPKDVKEKPEDVKEKPEDVKEKPEEASLGSATGAISQSTAELAVSENEQVASLVNEYTAKPTKPKDNWLPPHLRTPDYAFNDPRIVKPNRSYLNKTISSGEAPSENKKSSIEGSVTKPVAEVSSVPAQAVTSPDDPAPSEPILTPSSVIFRAVSPPAPTEGTKENREGLLYFSAWGKPEHRHKAGILLLIPHQRDRHLTSCSRQSPKSYHPAAQPHTFARCFTCVGWPYRRNSHQDKFSRRAFRPCGRLPELLRCHSKWDQVQERWA